jgi:hypothetical protein
MRANPAISYQTRFHGDNMGSNPIGDTKKQKAQHDSR